MIKVLAFLGLAVLSAQAKEIKKIKSEQGPQKIESTAPPKEQEIKASEQEDLGELGELEELGDEETPQDTKAISRDTP